MQRVNRWMGGVLGAAVLGAGGCMAHQQPAPVPETRASLDRVTGEAVDWIDAHAAPLTSVEPIANDADLLKLEAMVGGAHVVGLGTPVDGSHELITLSHRILTMLVQDSGFRAFAVDAPVLEAAAIDRYIRTGVGDPKKLIADLGSWPLGSEEMLNLVTWMRVYDTTHPTSPVGFYGLGMESPDRPTAAVLAFVQRTMGEQFRRWVYDQYWCTTRPEEASTGPRLPHWVSPFWNACVAAVVSVSDSLTAMHDKLVGLSSAADVNENARMAHLVLLRALVSANQLSHDAAMADNAVALLDSLGPQGKIVIWAHDASVGRFDKTGDLRLGDLLGKRLGPEYVSVGFAFGSGQFRSLRQKSDSQVDRRPSVFTAALPAVGSYERAFRLADFPDFYLDLRHPPSGDAETWLIGPHPFRTVGWTYDPDYLDKYDPATSLVGPWDVLVFVRDITADDPLPGVCATRLLGTACWPGT